VQRLLGASIDYRTLQVGALLAVGNKAIGRQANQQTGIVGSRIMKQFGGTNGNVFCLGNAGWRQTRWSPTLPPLPQSNQPSAKKQGCGDKGEKGCKRTSGNVVILFPIDREVFTPVRE
jgi:hypothetical protein